MSAYGTKVVAVLDTTSAFGVTIKTLKENVDALKTQMSTLLADAPETLDTLNEIAAAISDDPAFFSTMSTANTTLQSNIDADVTNRTAVVAALQALVDAATTARGVLSGRLDTLEADATTGTALAAVQADVDQNETDADAAIAAVQADVDQNETDADAAIAAVQADVDQNESDADQAIALRAPINDSVLTGLTTMASAKFSTVLTDAADDTAAASAGIAVGQLYRNGSVVMIRVS